MATTVPAARARLGAGSDLPRALLVADAATAAPTGLLLLAATGPVDDFLGLGSPAAVAAGGALFLAYAARLAWSARREQIRRADLLFPIAVNAAWVLGSALVLLGGTPDLSTRGAWAVGVVADLVAVLAVAQVVALRRLP